MDDFTLKEIYCELSLEIFADPYLYFCANSGLAWLGPGGI